MDDDQQFCLRWNNHQSTLVAVFDTLLENGTLVDCTLAAEGKCLNAHKVVLSACSPFFEALLSRHFDKHPILILKDVKFQELKAMMDYMYRGEVNISQDQLGALLKAAESLQIKGLSDNRKGETDRKPVTQPPPAKSPQPSTLPKVQGLTIEQRSRDDSRDGSQSPGPRKKKRMRRKSDDLDNHHDASNSSESHSNQALPAQNIPSMLPASKNADVPEPVETKSEILTRHKQQQQCEDSSPLVPIKEKLETHTELMLEPKSEYVDEMNEDSIEDLTLDDDDISNMESMDDGAGPSHGNAGEGSSQGFGGWHMGNQSQDEVFLAAQEAVGAHRDSQGLEMYLYNITLQRATAITHAIHGNFSGTKTQEIVISRGKSLELLRPDPNTGKVHTLLTVEVFGVVRSLMSFRLMGSTKDYVIIGSDSGRIGILEYQPAKNAFEKVHQETFGKSGVRRIVPGQYLATDPGGRAVMIGAIEKQKLAYILNRDDQARLTISSPLEAHKSNTLVYHMVGVDVKYENPMFACLEIDYEEADSDPTGEAAQKTQQTLTFYELDLGVNHVVRKYSEPLEEHANFLVTVPGGDDGPSGVLICSENYLTYKNLGDQHDIRCPIPRRRNDLDDPERGMIFVCSATHKTKSMFFFLAQTEQGDIFKITLETDEDMVTEIKLKYFDTVPVATAMCVLKTGFLFVASEFGNHYLYQIAHLGDDDDELEFSSAMPLEEGDTFFFAPRALRNLVLVDELESLSPILSSRVADLAGEDTPQLYMLCGRGPRSSLRVLRHGLEVSEMAVSELPGSPNAVWTVKRRSDDEFDAYIIVSFGNATLVLSIGETVEEVTDSGFLGTTPTLSCSALSDDALVQVYPDGIRHICADKRVNEWKAPGKKKIVKCAVNQRQVVIALSGGELVYFEMDPTGQLHEYKERKRMNSDVVCMALANVAAGEQLSLFLAVGLADNTVRIISLDPSDCLAPRSMQGLPVCAESLCIVEMGCTDREPDNAAAASTTSTLYLNIGLQNGALLRTVLDPVSGDLSDTRTRYLGSRPVKLFRIRMQQSEAVLAMSSRSWLSYYYQNRFYLTPLSYESLEYASGFSSEQCPEGIVAISTNTLRILALEKLGAVFNQVSFPLEYTPRKFIIHPESNSLIIIETEHNAYTEETKSQRRLQMAEEMKEAAGEEEQELAKEMADAFLNEDLPESIFSAPKAGHGMWASILRIMDPVQGHTHKLIRLDQNEAAMSIVLVRFQNQPQQFLFLIVGIAKDFQLNPRHCNSGFLDTYKIDPNGRELEFVHRTPVDEVPMALCAYNGLLLAGVGRMLRLYDMGKKKLLRKCENKHIPNGIVNIQALGKRIFVSDVQESVFMVRYKRAENQLIIFADDTHPRWITCTSVLDYDTVGTADKFGNIGILRLPPNVSDDVEEDPTGHKSLWDRGLLNGASQKADTIATFHVGETVTWLQKATLIPGGWESMIYTTLSGTVGVLVPFTSREDHDFFQHLEMHMRSENSPLCGRDHISFRSYYYPVKNVIDGDLCEQYNSLEPAKQKSIASDLDRTSADVSKRLEEIRTRYAF